MKNKGYRQRVWFKFLNFYCMTAHYPSGTSLPAHVDGDDSPYKVYRFILELKLPAVGGRLFSDGFIINWPRIKLLRVDKYRHGVTNIESGVREVFTLTLLRKK